MKKFSLVTETIKFGKHQVEKERVLYSDADFFMMFDGFPVSPGHILIIDNMDILTSKDRTNSIKIIYKSI